MFKKILFTIIWVWIITGNLIFAKAEDDINPG
jgi:hypothetical protein